MPELSRREFLKNAATSAAAAGFLSAGALDLHANPLGLPIGCQTWPVREMIAKDFPAAASTLMVPGKSLAIISRTGQVWHPIGSPNGFAPSSTAPAQSALATAACLAVLLTNSLLVIVDICPSKLGSKDTPPFRSCEVCSLPRSKIP